MHTHIRAFIDTMISAFANKSHERNESSGGMSVENKEQRAQGWKREELPFIERLLCSFY